MANHCCAMPHPIASIIQVAIMILLKRRALEIEDKFFIILPFPGQKFIEKTR
jgi:hypothetical protein